MPYDKRQFLICALAVGLIIVAVSNPFTLMLAPFCLVYIGLSIGFSAAIAVTAAAGALLALSGQANLLVPIGLMFFAPSLFLLHRSLMSRQTDDGYIFYPPERVIVWALSFAALAALMLYGLELRIEGGLAAQMAKTIAQEPQLTALLANNANLDTARLQFLLRASLIAAPAFWMLFMLAALWTAQIIAENLGNNIRPTPDYERLSLPIAAAVALGITMCAALTLTPPLSDFMTALTASLIAAYFLLGLAGIHASLRQRKERLGLLIALYLLLALVIWVAVPIAVYGLWRDTLDMKEKD